VLIPKTIAPAVLDGRVRRARLPLNRWTEGKAKDTLRIARYDLDEDGRVVKVKAGRFRHPLIIETWDVVMLDAATDDDAHQEGYDNATHLRDEWIRTYRTAFTGTQGWLVQFRLDRTETIRLLPRQQGARFEHGVGDREDAGQYTSSVQRALFDEPEAVDPREVERGRTALECRQRFVRAKLQDEARLARLSLGQRIDLELAAARAAGQDTARAERAITARLDAMSKRRAS
jgi:hypothetical protein